MKKLDFFLHFSNLYKLLFAIILCVIAYKFNTQSMILDQLLDVVAITAYKESAYYLFFVNICKNFALNKISVMVLCCKFCKSLMSSSFLIFHPPLVVKGRKPFLHKNVVILFYSV